VSKRAARAEAPFPAVFATHGVVLSDHRTPPSLASCSKVTGTKEPGNGVSSRCLNQKDFPYQYHKLRRPQQPDHKHKSPSAQGSSLGTDLHRHIEVRADYAASAQLLHLPSVLTDLTDHTYECNCVEVHKQPLYETGVKPSVWHQISVSFAASEGRSLI